MTSVVFYEKPGCGTNARQKLMLTRAGHTVIAKSLLSEPWSGERLLAFFAGTPVTAWFNPASPRVKSGEVKPDGMAAETAIDLMLADPLLIRRPLVEAAGQSCAGFDREPVVSLLRMSVLESVAIGKSEECSRPDRLTPCPTPASSCSE